MVAKIHVYRTYQFVNKDPVIDKLRTIVADEGIKEGHIADMAGLSHTTLKNWFRGDTRRPQFASIMATTRALGYDLTFKRQKNRVDVEQELKDAAAEKLAKKSNGKGKVREFRW